jgi:hypothetical protein
MERAFIDSVTKERGAIDLLFVRLCQYAHGGHHMDEIVWRENITHGDVNAVLQEPKFAACLSVIVR